MRILVRLSRLLGLGKRKHLSIPKITAGFGGKEVPLTEKERTFPLTKKTSLSYRAPERALPVSRHGVAYPTMLRTTWILDTIVETMFSPRYYWGNVKYTIKVHVSHLTNRFYLCAFRGLDGCCFVLSRLKKAFFWWKLRLTNYQIIFASFPPRSEGSKLRVTRVQNGRT